MSYYHYQTIQKLLKIYKAWELYDDHSTCDIVFPQLIHGVPWKFLKRINNLLKKIRNCSMWIKNEKFLII